jgi:adenylylsulfate kinase-like enzyme
MVEHPHLLQLGCHGHLQNLQELKGVKSLYRPPQQPQVQQDPSMFAPEATGEIQLKILLLLPK